MADQEARSAAKVRVREDVLLESGGVLKAGTVCKVFAETEDAFGVEWVEDGLHSMAIAAHKVEVVQRSGCARPMSAERDGAVNAKDNLSATGEGAQ